MASETTATLRGDVGDRVLAELVNMKAVLQRWEREGIKLLPAHEESEVVAALRRLGRPFSQNIVRLYCATGGMADGEMDNQMFSVWTLDKLVVENSKHMRPHILFGDFLIDSHSYGLKYEDAENSSVYVDYFGGEPPQRVADSLDEFFYLYLSDPSKIRLWGET